MICRRRWLGLPVVLVLIASCSAPRPGTDGEHEVKAGSDPRVRVPAQPSGSGGSPLRRTGARRPAIALDIAASGAEAPIRLEVGQALRIQLPSSAASGYDWALQGGLPPLLRMETDPGGEPLSALRAGATAAQTWSFRAEHPGHATLSFAYRRPWEAGSVPARIAAFDITVD